MPPKAKGKKAGARKMPPPLPKGEVLTDAIRKQQWVIGASIGTGGFGEIYIATQKGQDIANAKHVIKIEPHENGPLFSELSYYRRVAKEDRIDSWVMSECLKYLPIPKYITSGSHDVGDVRYRFMVMQRFGMDIEKHFRASSSGFSEDTVSFLALRLLEALEFLHESEYVHADIKGSNLLTGLGRDADRVYLVDYGLAFRFNPEGSHKVYKEDPKRAHDGTIEFTSIDAHNGVCPARRGDLEILGYCLLQWASGKLPWEDNLVDKNYVARRKKEYKGKAGKLVVDCFGSSGSRALQSYMTEVYKLQYTDKPPYSKLRKIFEDQLGGHDPRKTLEWMPRVKPAKPVKRLLEEGPSVPPKRRKHSQVALALPKMRKQPSSEGSDQVDLGEKKKKAKTVTKKAALPVADRPPPILCLQEEKTAKVKTAAMRKQAKPAAEPVAPQVLYPQGSDQVGVGGKKAKEKVTTLEARFATLPIADRLPDVVYPLELGYVNSKGKKVEGGSERVKPVVKDSRDVQRKGRKSPLKDKGIVKRREEVRRSERNRGRVVNYTDLSSSFNDNQGATPSYHDEEDIEGEEEETATKQKRRRT